MGYDFPPGNNLLGDASTDNIPRSFSSNHSDSGDEWVHIDGSNWCVMNVSILIGFTFAAGFLSKFLLSIVQVSKSMYVNSFLNSSDSIESNN